MDTKGPRSTESSRTSCESRLEPLVLECCIVSAKSEAYDVGLREVTLLEVMGPVESRSTVTR